MKHLGTPPFVCLITQGEATSENCASEFARIVDVVRSAIDDGVTMIQVREKRLPARLLFELVNQVVSIARDSEALVIVNDRADIAAAAEADGVHLPETSLRPDVVRKAFQERLLVGASVHEVQAVSHVSELGADYLFFAPVFESPGKGAPAGLENLQAACKEASPIPVIALGGINESNCQQAIEAGAAGVSAIRALHETQSRRRILSALR